MSTGWIKLHRELIKKPIWQCSTPEQKVILITLLMMANHDTKEWEWKGEKYHCKPGEFVTSAKSIQKKAGEGISRQNIRTALKRFEKYEFLTIETTKVNTKIFIQNWEKYQSKEQQPNQDANHQLTISQPTANHQLTTNKNDKNDKNDKKGITTTVAQTLSPKEVISMWNAIGVNPIKAINPGTKRHSALNARIREHGAEAIVKAINNARESDFLKGKNKNAWTITFDWFIAPNNFLKVYENAYVNRDGRDGWSSSKPPTNPAVEAARALFEKYKLEEEKEAGCDEIRNI
ncbi:MAG: hypothetical protein QM221_04755 [Bacillota bacterium]|nr:hypothetical protein [Bacillota bacterium]